jgi:hypothetical protein
MVDDVSGVVGVLVGGGVVGGGAAIVVSRLAAVSIGAGAGGGRLGAVSEGETLPVSGGACPTPLFSLW